MRRCNTLGLSQKDHRAVSDAIEAGDIDAVRLMLQQDPDLANNPQWTPPPLHCAILWNQPEVAELLLDSGADIEMLDPDRQTTPLRYAIMFGKTALIPLLISRGANTGPIVEGGESSIQLAKSALSGQYKDFDDLPRPKEYQAVVDVLLKAGIDQ